jgi:hypothetical protein
MTVAAGPASRAGVEAACPAGGACLLVAAVQRNFDVTIEDGKVATYRVRLDLSFKYDSGD